MWNDRILVEGAANLGVSLDGAQRQRFAAYYDLLMEDNAVAGLTTITQPEAVQQRHFLDSLALIPALEAAGHPFREGSMVVDLGAGAGFPGVPVAIVAQGVRVTLLESHGRRADFLRRLVRALGVVDRVDVVQGRAEDIARRPGHREQYDIALARALAPLAVLVELALPFVRLGGVLAAIKGARAAQEMEEAELALHELGGGASRTIEVAHGPEEKTRVVLIEKTAPTPDRYPRRPGIPAKRPLLRKKE